MIISDLNYLENTSEEIFGGRGVAIANTFDTKKRVNSYVQEDFVKSVTTNLNGLKGNTAELVASADATGPDTFSSVIGGTQTETDRSESFVNATSVSK